MIFENSPISNELHNHWRKKICSSFPIFKKINHQNYLSIYKYINNTPEKFYSQKSYNDFLNFFLILKTENPKILSNLINKQERRISLALKYLNEINLLKIHDNVLPTNDFELLRFINNDIHYNYLKLIEGVFGVFIFPLAYIETINRNKKPDSLKKITSCVDVLKGTDYKYLTEVFHNTVRNGIAHGDISYTDREIIYTDIKGKNEKLDNREIIKIFDETLDICNGIALSLKVFSLVNLDFFEINKIQIPRQILLEELKVTSNAPGWEVVDLLESHISHIKSQLIIYVKTSFIQYDKALYFTVRTVLLTEKFATGYERYFFYLDCKYGTIGWAGFDGLLLTKLRKRKETQLDKYAKALEDGYIFFNPKIKLPKIYHVISNFFLIVKTNFPVIWEELQKEYFPKIINPRVLTIHKSGNYSVINGTVVILNETELSDSNFIRIYCSKIVKKAIRKVKKDQKPFKLCKHLKVGFLRIAVYSKDFRKRKLHNCGLVKELICTVELKRLKSIKSPDICGGVPELINNYKIVWNKNWQNFVKEIKEQ